MLNYFLELGSTTFNTVSSKPTIISNIITPLGENREPNGTPDAFSVAPAVCASGTSSANIRNNTTTKMIAVTASVTLLAICPFLLNFLIVKA